MEPSCILSNKSDAPVSETNASSTNHTKYKEIISTLPRTEDRWYQSQQIREYQGFRFSQIMLQGIMSAQEQFKAQPTDIFICSHPKSGTTWLKALSFAILTRKRFIYPSTNPLLSELPHDVVPFIETLSFTDITSRDPELPLLSTHMPYTSLPKSVVECKCKIIYICRDPKDSFVSMWHFAGKLRGTRAETFPLEEACQKFCEGLYHGGPYWDHVLGFWKASLQFPERMLFIKYEDLQNDTFSYVRRMAEFMGCPFSMEEERQGLVQKVVDLCSFEILSNLEVNKSKKHSSSLRHIWKVEKNAFFRKGKVGDWENYLTADMAATIDQITEQKFSGSGLSFKAP
ncbi:hypothetical protein P3X46_025313 [Hevea brasiliensis]|uniref:Sulfotransferase n=1 Tax=Hevea brasiliensis TaxID=3981 RepID=A0ABQ9L5C4_HEVBR|nr:flavonol sulfotransferase-like [Hevea brasiliensis]KAJ9159852.1 hypothetical protein P3X46_025313 [Hevea brasiliensis]